MLSDSPNQPLSEPLQYAFTAFAALTVYNSVELIVLTLATFKRYQGLYFWSLLVSSCSLITNTLGFALFFFAPISNYICVTIILVGWYCMVTGHSLVLWSRLHLVLQSPKVLRGILYLIITDAVLLHIPVTVLLYGAVSPNPDIESRFVVGYNVIERIQLIMFCLQESLLSAIYIWETAKLLRLRPQRAHSVILVQLIAINIIILILDVIVVVFQYTGLFALQVVFKPVAYSIKLRLEYAILGRLVLVASGSEGGSSARVFSDEVQWPSVPSCEDEECQFRNSSPRAGNGSGGS
ncbi:uncharacterized protein BDV17DRAFT_276358 [Aspergillus undulatus]|uniref:Integral membrane protein n=1 Tax=Emericella variicolor TaxID=1549217 RepID=A0A6J3ZV76_EMEVA|nr:integral membrane protein [Aspergillus stellatus]